MKKIYFLLLFIVIQFSNAQVDIVYNDLVWSDEFENNGTVNASNWHHQTQIPSGGSWYNNEVQHYTNLLANSFVENGQLNIVAKRQTFNDQGVTKQFTSARLNSKFAFKYGRVDIRAKVPTNQGTWPALWLLGKNITEPGGYFSSQYGTTSWPACGEIDIMEHGIFPSEPAGFIGSAIHTTSSSGNTVNKGGIVANGLGNDYHVYSMNWSPNEITFLLDGVAYYTYNPPIKNASTWPFDEEQYLLLNIAMGGYAGNIPAAFNQATMAIDYVRVYQNIIPDDEPPTNFTVSVGEILPTSVELLLNATDNSGNIRYDVTYGTSSSFTFGQSGIQKSLVIPNLTPNNTYQLTVTARDLSDNYALNSPIVLNATTLAESTLICSGTSSAAQVGSFSTGYFYEYKTEGNNVKITYTLLDTGLTGVVGILWRQTPFAEIPLTPLGNNSFTHTLTNQTIGEIITYGVKFAYAGGLSVTSYYNYEVGSTCNLNVTNNMKEPNIYFNNPARDYINIQSDFEIKDVKLYSLTGALVLKTKETHKIDVSAVKSGLYFIVISNELHRIVKKIIID